MKEEISLTNSVKVVTIPNDIVLHSDTEQIPPKRIRKRIKYIRPAMSEMHKSSISSHLNKYLS